MDIVVADSATSRGNNRSNRRRNANRKRPGSTVNRNLPNNIDRAQFNMPLTVSFPPNCVGFPDRLVAVLKYVESNTHSGSAVPSAQKWAVNSAYDPNNSGTGHQPSFFDSLSAIYGRYFVRHFKVEVEIVNQLATTALVAVVCYTDQDISANTVEQISESKYARWVNVGINTGGSSVRHISMPWMSSMKLMGTPGLEADDNMYAASGASPADIGWCITRIAAIDGTTTMTAIVKTSIYMEIVFKDLLPQISS
jgi:hypothetical protein